MTLPVICWAVLLSPPMRVNEPLSRRTAWPPSFAASLTSRLRADSMSPRADTIATTTYGRAGSCAINRIDWGLVWGRTDGSSTRMSALTHAKAASRAATERRRIWSIKPARLVCISDTRATGKMFARPLRPLRLRAAYPPTHEMRGEDPSQSESRPLAGERVPPAGASRARAPVRHRRVAARPVRRIRRRGQPRGRVQRPDCGRAKHAARKGTGDERARRPVHSAGTRSVERRARRADPPDRVDLARARRRRRVGRGARGGRAAGAPGDREQRDRVWLPARLGLPRSADRRAARPLRAPARRPHALRDSY